MSSVALQGVVSGWIPEVRGVLKLVQLQHRHITYIHCCIIVLMFYNVLRINDVKMATTNLNFMKKLSAIFILFNTLLSADSFFIHELQ